MRGCPATAPLGQLDTPIATRRDVSVIAQCAPLPGLWIRSGWTSAPVRRYEKDVLQQLPLLERQAQQVPLATRLDVSDCHFKHLGNLGGQALGPAAVGAGLRIQHLELKS